MIEDRLLNRYYKNALKWDRSSRKFAYGGTSYATKHVLDVLGSKVSDTGCQAELYDFTDISNGFFEAARKKFSD
ncbi:hypothetical protein D6C98_10046 [Aureobasidium pullulans]|nr:hypothetical protein D6C98_10046 [Aureobasidium pullulans]